MEDSFRIWRRNAKSLTWPIVGRSSITTTENTSSNSASSSSSVSLLADNKVVEKKSKVTAAGGDQHLEIHNKLKAEFTGDIAIQGVSASSSLCGDVQQGATLGAAASAKKKSKRRRNQALCKGKQIQNLRKPPATASGNNSTSNSGKSSHHRNTSPAWDTDFKGCWEMGPDLIKEFLARQKGTNTAATKRSRSNSDSMDVEARNEYKMLSEIPKSDELLSGIERPLMKRYVDISFCYDDASDDRQNYEVVTDDGVDYVDEDYDDDNTLASIEEFSSGSNGGNIINARRLYQREGTLQKPLVVCKTGVDDSYLDDCSESADHLDFANFKAKFNSSVEALWKDVEPQTTTTAPQQQGTFEGAVNTGPITNPIGISSAFYATTSLNALAPFKQDLWNFWSNYNNQPPQAVSYDQMAKLSTNNVNSISSSMITTTQRLDDSSASSGAGADIANSSDYYSMPSNLDDFDKSVGAMRRINEAGASLGCGGGGGAHTPSMNLFLQNSIWSSSGDCVDAVGAANESDESFLYKVWHSNKKLSQIDMAAKNKNEKVVANVMSGVGDMDCGSVIYSSKASESHMEGGNGAKLEFPPYNNLKWSEGINAGPAYNSLRSNAVVSAISGDIENCGDASKYVAAYGSAAAITSTGANWEAPIYGQNTQPDLKSWCASNPMSLTEMYGNDVCDSITEDVAESVIDAPPGPEVTLPNHCAATSGFIAYARIKASGVSVVQPQTKPLQSQQVAHMASDYFRGGEEENLLTSERTHFHPIETYVDGYTFDISSALDCVEFERSASGYLCYDSNEYLEYTRNDIYLADEEVSNTNLMNFSASASSQVADGRVHAAKEKPENKEVFVLKFKLRRSGEMACQTEEIDFQLAAAKMSNQPQMSGIDAMEMSMFSLDNSLSLSRQANNEAIMAAVTQAVAAAAKAAAEQQGLHKAAQPQNTSLAAWVPAVTRSDCSTQSWVQDASLCDEVDFCRTTAVSAEQLSQFWSMQEVEKQCQQRRLPPRSTFARVDLDRNEDSSLDNSSHTLWGMCAVCNSCDYGKSLPANRLLRDELKLEADEIMSDLRYMQDLYIGESDSVAENVNDTSDGDAGDHEAGKQPIMGNKGNNEYNVGHLQDHNESAVQTIMLLKVNKLIEDLLRPEQTGKLIRANPEKEEEETLAENMPMANDWSMTVDDDAAVDNSNSWHFSRDQQQCSQPMHNIWQHDASENLEKEKAKFVAIKPMKLLRQVGGSLNEEDLYADKLNWEHEHLAKIWQRDEEAVMVATTNQECKTNFAEEGNNIEIKNEEKPQVLEIVEQKNLKNLQNSNNTTPPSTASSASSMLATNNTAAYKRVQQFLNSSAAKLKLAANRKRRHSASQNFYKNHSLHSNNNNSNNNNNNDNITDLNRYKFEEKMTMAPTELPMATRNTNNNDAAPKQTIITCKYWTTSTNGTQASMDSAAAAMMLLAAAANKTTIIDGSDGVDIMTAATANTTTNSHYDEDTNDEGIMLEDNTFGNTFSCLIDKNASILKHVTMMTRPLTR
ncbi:uncharacterized protein isoform X2 [Musca autumnalis]